jgi:hypothetical protein
MPRAIKQKELSFCEQNNTSTTMIINMKAISLIVLLFGLISCNESPTIDFHSYEEMTKYNFIENGWFPEILNEDAINIDETYNIVNKHAFGKFDFKNRTKYDSVIRTYPPITKDSLSIMIDKIERPVYPDWFITKDSINYDKYILAKHNDFFLIMDKTSNRIYFLR